MKGLMISELTQAVKNDDKDRLMEDSMSPYPAPFSQSCSFLGSGPLPRWNRQHPGGDKKFTLIFCRCINCV